MGEEAPSKVPGSLRALNASTRMAWREASSARMRVGARKSGEKRPMAVPCGD